MKRKNMEVFISEFEEKHDHNNDNFEQSQGSQIHGNKKEKHKLNNEKFKLKGIQKHGLRFDYSNVVYVNNITKVKITCNDCNYIFEQTPSNHLNGKGCAQCSRCTKLTTEEFKIRGQEKHGIRFDYGKVIYINNKTKVKITCNVCNYEFEQIPHNHLRGYGCAHCSGILQLTTEEFKKKGKEKHGNKFSYEQSIYKNSHSKVKIGCNECNEWFEQTPNNHLSGQGCARCTGKFHLTTEEFKKRARKKHGKKFDYNNVIYINCDIKINIGCNECKQNFEQTPGNHLSGRGCPNCITYKGEEQIQKVLQKLSIHFEIHKRLKMGDSNLELDFYFLINLIQNMGIERDGEQHFYPIGFGCKDKLKVQENFKNCQRRDKIKNEWCQENNYHLLRISFMTPLEEYEQLIIEFLQESEQHKGQPFIKYDKFYEELLESTID